MKRSMLVAACSLSVLVSQARAAPTTVDVRYALSGDGPRLIKAIGSALGTDAHVSRGEPLDAGEPGVVTTPDDAPLVAFVHAVDDDGRHAIRIGVVDRRTLLRVASDVVPADTSADDVATLVAASIRHGITKASERVDAVALIAPTVARDLDRAAVPAAALAGDWIEAELLARPNTFVAESEFYRYLAPVPAASDTPSSVARPTWLIASEIEPDRRDAPRGDGRTTVRIAATAVDGAANPRVRSTTIDAPGAALSRVRALTRQLDLTPPATAAAASAPATRPAVEPLDAFARASIAAGDFETAAATLERAVAATPADISLRRELVADYVDAIRRATDYEQRRKAPDAMRDLDRRAGLYFRMLPHLNVLLENAATLRDVMPGDAGFFQKAISSIDRFVFTGDLQRAPAERDRRAQYLRATSRVFQSWAGERLRANREGAEWVLWEALYFDDAAADPTGAGAMSAVGDGFAAFVEANKDLPGLSRKLFVFGDLLTQRPEQLDRFLKRVATLGPSFAAGADVARARSKQLAEAQARGFAEIAAMQAAREPALPIDASPDLGFEPIDFPWQGVVAAGDVDVVWAGKRMVARLPDGTQRPLVTLSDQMPILNDRFGDVVFDGRYVWAPIRRLRRETSEPTLVVIDARTLAVRTIGAADGLPTMNGDDAQRGWSPSAIAPVGEGRVVLVGTGDRAWVATLTLDEMMDPTVDVVLQTRVEPDRADKARWRDVNLNFVPAGALPIGGDAAARGATHVLILRADSTDHPIVYSLADRSFAAVETRLDTGVDACARIGPEVFWLRSWAVGNGGADLRNKQILRRYDVAARRFVDVLDPAAVTVGQDARLFDLDGRPLIVGTRAFLAETPTGPFRPLGGLPPAQATQVAMRPRLARSARQGLILWQHTQTGEQAFRVTLHTTPTTRPTD